MRAVGGASVKDKPRWLDRRFAPSHSILWSLTAPTCCAVALLVIGIGVYTPHAVMETAMRDAVNKSQHTARELLELRTFYSEHVVSRSTAGGVRASPAYKDEPASIPVPTTFILDVAQSFATVGGKVSLVSPYPWPTRHDRVLDDFQREAWFYLKDNPGSVLSRRDRVDGQEVLRVAVSDTMSASCVECHNNHPSSPKNDWKIGEVRGVVEVVQPVDALAAGAYALSWKLVAGTGIAGVVLLGLLLANGRRLIQPLQELVAVIYAIARGDLSVSVPHTERRDELGTVAQALTRLKMQADQRKAAETQIAHMAHHDALTGLPNRVLFRDRMEHALKSISRRGGSLAMLYLDLDLFKGVNDTLGHPIGDALLRIAADRLRGCVREADTIARLGGDEFAVVQLSARQPDDAFLLANRIIEVLGSPYDVEGHRILISTSIGIAIGPDDGIDPDILLKKADVALYQAKAEGRGKFRLFELKMDVALQTRRLLETDLRNALARDEFELYFQPYVDLSNAAVRGFEALLRWHHPERGMVPPTEFIPLAEETGLIVPIGEWVLRAACAEAASWPSGIAVAVNLSAVQFSSANLVHAVTSALEASGLSPARLELEVTETVFLQRNNATLLVLHHFRDLGVRIAMDDFGTGYSSLSYLKSFPFDKIKIDQSFVRDLAERKDSLAIVRAVTGLGESLGMVTIAEGIETPEQFEQLRAQGCLQGQGYLFGRPQPASEIAAYLARAQTPVRAMA